MEGIDIETPKKPATNLKALDPVPKKLPAPKEPTPKKSPPPVPHYPKSDYEED
jgi:hypothetical protein